MEDFDYNREPVIALCDECSHPYHADELHEIEEGSRYLSVCRDCKLEIQREQAHEERSARSISAIGW